MDSVSPPPLEAAGQKQQKKAASRFWAVGKATAPPDKRAVLVLSNYSTQLFLDRGVSKQHQHYEKQYKLLALKCHLMFFFRYTPFQTPLQQPKSSPSKQRFHTAKGPATEVKETPSLHFWSSCFTTSLSHVMSDVTGVPVCGSTMGIVVFPLLCNTNNVRDPGLQPWALGTVSFTQRPTGTAWEIQPNCFI